MLLPCTIDIKITWVFWIVFSSNVEDRYFGRKLTWMTCTTEGRGQLAKNSWANCCSRWVSWEWESWLAAEHWVMEQTDLSPFLPLVKFNLHVPSSQLQEDIWILGVFLILLVLSFTWYLCARPLQNTPMESYWGCWGPLCLRPVSVLQCYHTGKLRNANLLL